MCKRRFFKILALILTASLATMALAQEHNAARRINFNGVSYDLYTVNPQLQTLRFYWKDITGNPIANFTKLEHILREQHKQLRFATNGGIFEPQLIPTGLYIESASILVPINNSKGKGNFYLKPNGVFFIKDSRFAILESHQYLKASPKPQYALQSGPLLINNGKIHPKFGKSSSSLYIRNGVGIHRDGSAVFAISNEPVNLYDFARLFLEFLECDMALYLDGAISKMYLPALNRTDSGGHFTVLIGSTDK